MYVHGENRHIMRIYGVYGYYQVDRAQYVFKGVKRRGNRGDGIKFKYSAKSGRVVEL